MEINDEMIIDPCDLLDENSFIYQHCEHCKNNVLSAIEMMYTVLKRLDKFKVEAFKGGMTYYEANEKYFEDMDSMIYDACQRLI